MLLKLCQTLRKVRSGGGNYPHLPRVCTLDFPWIFNEDACVPEQTVTVLLWSQSGSCTR